jgi:hypothetical protein
VIFNQSYSGRATYYPDYVEPPHRLFVAVSCYIGDNGIPLVALLDCASEWCVLSAIVAEDAGLELESDGITVSLDSRFGIIAGRLERLPLRLMAMEGDSAEIEATCFVSADWPGPMVIGWKGCLERIRFGLDPSEDAFYFASL